MSFVTDIRSVSEGALDQVSARFDDLPRPLLAAIGAGDMAVERLAELREALKGSIPTVAGGPPDVSGVRSAAADLPSRAQQVAADVANSIEHFATQTPAKAQELIADLPEKVTEIAQSLSPDAVRQTLEAYTQLAAMIYGNLADRGDKTWSRVRGSRRGPTVVDAASTAPPAKAATAAADAGSVEDAKPAKHGKGGKGAKDAGTAEAKPVHHPRATGTTASARAKAAAGASKPSAKRPAASHPAHPVGAGSGKPAPKPTVVPPASAPPASAPAAPPPQPSAPYSSDAGPSNASAPADAG